MVQSAETRYLHLLITEYDKSVESCDDINIDQLFSSLSIRLLVFHLE